MIFWLNYIWSIMQVFASRVAVICSLKVCQSNTRIFDGIGLLPSYPLLIIRSATSTHLFASLQLGTTTIPHLPAMAAATRLPRKYFDKVFSISIAIPTIGFVLCLNSQHTPTQSLSLGNNEYGFKLLTMPSNFSGHSLNFARSCSLIWLTRNPFIA